MEEVKESAEYRKGYDAGFIAGFDAALEQEEED